MNVGERIAYDTGQDGIALAQREARMQTSRALWNRTPLGISEAATRRLQFAIWLAMLLLAIAMNVVMLPRLLQDALELSDMDLSAAEQVAFRQRVESLGISVRTLTIVGLIGSVVQEAVVAGVSVVLLLKRKGTDWFAFYLALTMIAGIGAMYPPALSDLVGGNPFWLVVGKITTALSVTSLFLIPFLFPTGRFAPRWMIVPAALMVLGVLSFVIAPGDDAGGDLGTAPEMAINLALLAAIAGSVRYRYRNLATPIQRQQMKWGIAGAAIALPVFLLGDALMRNIDGSMAGVLSMIGWSIAMPIASLVFPVCLTVAILRYRLWDIDLLVSRTLVWLCMTALVIAAYAGIVFGVGSLFPRGHSIALSLGALGLTAVLFEPVHRRVRQGVNRLFFGDRDDPYRVVRKLADDLSETVLPAEALRATVRTLTESLRLPYAAITLEPGALPVAMAGIPGVAEVPIPLTYQSQPVGELIVSPRTGSREFDAADRALLDELARQIGVVAHNVRLTNDLQASRERIVTAREEERRRLRHDLHDGLGAQLAALTLQTGALKSTIRTDPETAVAEATELQAELRTAVADIRRLVQGLRPAALDDLGLIGALSARIATVELGCVCKVPRRGVVQDLRVLRWQGSMLQQDRDVLHDAGSEPTSSLQTHPAEWSEPNQRPLLVTLDAPDDLGPLPAAVEVAIYRIVDEALANLASHADATRCRVVLRRTPGRIRLQIEDDGSGISASQTSGIGLQKMRERALELGGALTIEPLDPSGTRIVADLPVGEE